MTPDILIRIWKFLEGLQEIVESISCNSVVFSNLDEFGSPMKIHVRWWAPATWLAWIRTVVLMDNSGSGPYRRKETQQIKQDTVFSLASDLLIYEKRKELAIKGCVHTQEKIEKLQETK